MTALDPAPTTTRSTTSTDGRTSTAGRTSTSTATSGRRSRWPAVGAAVAGAGLLGVVVHDGSPGWQVIRGGAVVLLTAAALATVTRRATRPAGGTTALASVVAVVAGAVLLSVGLAVAGPHLAKAGPSPLAASGVLAVAGGLVLLVGGSGSLLRRVRWWGRLPLGLGVAAVALVAAAVVVPAVASTNVPATSLGTETPADVGLAYEDVSFPTSDGDRLSGWYLPSTNGAAVALLHGAGSTRSAVLPHAAVLARRGYGVLLYDAPGHGRSGGRAMDLGWTGEPAVVAAITFLAARPEVDDDRLGVVGLSMGGEVALGATARDPRIAAVVAEGATARSAGDKAWLSDVHGWRGQVQEGIEHLQLLATDLLTEAGAPIELRAAVAAAGRPTLLVAAGTVADEVDASSHIRSGSPATVEVWTVDGAGHTGGLDTDPAGWERRVVGFLDAHLRSPASG